MLRRSSSVGLVLLLGGSLACTESPGPAGGASTFAVRRPLDLEQASPGLSPEERTLWFAGRALARQPWVRAPSVTDARDGLGPLYDARSCFGCHVDGSRGVAPEAGPLIGMVVRIGRPDGSLLEAYGPQLQTRALGLGGRGGGGLRREAVLHLSWEAEASGLRRPQLEAKEPGYGPLPPSTRLSLRATPGLLGVGLLEAVPDAVLLRAEDPDDADGDGISGRAARLDDGELGRFGWKALQPDLRGQVGAALSQDMGLTNPERPESACTPAQEVCLQLPHGAERGGFEVSPGNFELLLAYQRALAVPARRGAERPEVRAGERQFEVLGCDACHSPTLRTGAAPERWRSVQRIHPYTDLLLHDMGPGLDDGLPEGAATGSEWRTPPLWGIGLAQAFRKQVGFLHDGRARSLSEAIEWHGGEAEASKQRYLRAGAPERRALLAFLRSL